MSQPYTSYTPREKAAWIYCKTVITNAKGGGRAGGEALCKWAFEKMRIKSQSHFHDTRYKHKSKIKKPRTATKGEKSSHGISAFWKFLRNHYKPMLWKINWKTVFLNSLKGYVLCSLLLSSIFRLKPKNTISYMKFYKHLCFLDFFISSTRIYRVLPLCQVLATEPLIWQSTWLQELIVLGKEPKNRMGWGRTGPNGACPVDETTRHGHSEHGGTTTGDLNKVRKTLGGRAPAKVSRWDWYVEGGGRGGGGAEAARRLMQLQQKESESTGSSVSDLGKDLPGQRALQPQANLDQNLSQRVPPKACPDGMWALAVGHRRACGGWKEKVWSRKEGEEPSEHWSWPREVFIHTN